MQGSRSLTRLVPALLANEDAAVAKLVDLSQQKLITIAMSLGAPLEDAQEIVLDAIFATHLRLANLEMDSTGSEDPLFRYLVKAVQNGVHQRYRQESRELEAMASVAGFAATEGDDQRPRLVAASDDQQQAARPIWPARAAAESESSSSRKNKLREFLDTLSERDRRLLELGCATDRATWNEIARLVGLTAANTRQRYGRLMHRAQEILLREESSDAR